jgi:hypothetical protein
MTKYYDPHTGGRIHAPKPIFKPSEASKDTTRSTQWDCLNLLKGALWTPIEDAPPYGICEYYDSADFEQAMADWDEDEADFQEKLANGEVR